jgi:hypothetical protein
MTLTTLLLAAVAFAATLPCPEPVAEPQTRDVPSGWFKAGMRPEDYDVGTDQAVKRSGSASAFIKSRSAAAAEFATLMQTFTAADYLGKRVRLSGYVKSDGVKNWAGLWMRVDGPERKTLAFDNMQERPIKGTQDWTECTIVLDVAAEATDISMGLLLAGEGAVWVDDLKIEVVSTSVPPTGRSRGKPTNLDFEWKGGATPP